MGSNLAKFLDDPSEAPVTDKARKRFSPEQKAAALADVQGGMTLKAAAEKHKTSAQSLIQWKVEALKQPKPEKVGLLSRLAALEARVAKLEELLS